MRRGSPRFAIFYRRRFDLRGDSCIIERHLAPPEAASAGRRCDHRRPFVSELFSRARAGAARMLRRMRPAQIIVIVFALLVLAGALILTLPVSSSAGQKTGFLDCLFTAASATCVTGLTVVETGLHWSVFGQWVILILIQIGGMGFMSIAAIFYMVLRQKIGLKKRMLLAQALSMDSMGGIVSMVRNVVLGTLAVEGVGAALLTVRFCSRFSFTHALRCGVFHAVSAFCNAGFDILADVDAGGSLSAYAADPLVNLVIMALIVIGGLGFFVWGDIRKNRRFSKLSVYTRMVLVISGVLIFGGAALFAVLEWDNPATIGNMDAGAKLLCALFQSVTTRTAGFFTFSQAGMTDASKAVSDVLMFVGGSSGSTAGGLKTVTLGVTVLSAIAAARGRTRVSVWRHTIAGEQISQAYALFALMFALSLAGAVYISAANGCRMTDAVYETVSAIATVGLTAGLTPSLNAASHVILIIFMFFGRVGIMTISVGFLTAGRAEERFTYAPARMMIG